jgi:hypothetical protein
LGAAIGSSGLAAEAQLPTRVHSHRCELGSRAAGYSPELPEPREAYRFPQLCGLPSTTIKIQTHPLDAEVALYADDEPIRKNGTSRGSQSSGVVLAN